MENKMSPLIVVIVVLFGVLVILGSNFFKEQFEPHDVLNCEICQEAINAECDKTLISYEFAMSLVYVDSKTSAYKEESFIGKNNHIDAIGFVKELDETRMYLADEYLDEDLFGIIILTHHYGMDYAINTFEYNPEKIYEDKYVKAVCERKAFLENGGVK